jgi:hypothetical protein
VDPDLMKELESLRQFKKDMSKQTGSYMDSIDDLENVIEKEKCKAIIQYALCQIKHEIRMGERDA